MTKSNLRSRSDYLHISYPAFVQNFIQVSVQVIPSLFGLYTLSTESGSDFHIRLGKVKKTRCFCGLYKSEGENSLYWRNKTLSSFLHGKQGPVSLCFFSSVENKYLKIDVEPCQPVRPSRKR